MISVTKLLFARDYYGDGLRYTKNAHDMKMVPLKAWDRWLFGTQPRPAI